MSFDHFDRLACQHKSCQGFRLCAPFSIIEGIAPETGRVCCNSGLKRDLDGKTHKDPYFFSPPYSRIEGSLFYVHKIETGAPCQQPPVSLIILICDLFMMQYFVHYFLRLHCKQGSL